MKNQTQENDKTFYTSWIKSPPSLTSLDKSLCKEHEKETFIFPCLVLSANWTPWRQQWAHWASPNPTKSHESSSAGPTSGRWPRWTNNSFSFLRKSTSPWACLCPSWFYRNWPTPSELRSSWNAGYLEASLYLHHPCGLSMHRLHSHFLRYTQLPALCISDLAATKVCITTWSFTA